MAWFVLVIAGVFETVWATALGKSDGFKKLIPTIVYFIGSIISIGGLAYAVTKISVGTAYAVWVGIGATLTLLYSFITKEEAASPLKILFLAGIVLGVIGLKAVS